MFQEDVMRMETKWWNWKIRNKRIFCYTTNKTKLWSKKKKIKKYISTIFLKLNITFYFLSNWKVYINDKMVGRCHNKQIKIHREIHWEKFWHWKPLYQVCKYLSRTNNIIYIILCSEWYNFYSNRIFLLYNQPPT